MSVSLGVDPGKSGAIVVLEDGRVEEQFCMPVEEDEKGRRHINEVMLLDLFLLYQGNINAITIERQQMRSRQQGQFGVVDHHGWLRGVAAMLDCEVYNPRPQEWQTIIEDAQLETRFLFAPTADNPKARSIEAARHLIPDLDLTPGLKRVPFHGLADAALMALWGERRYYASSE